MSNITLNTKIVLRSATEADWQRVNPVLLAGEPGAETDSGRLKLGDGTTAWNSLPYVQGVTAQLGSGAPGAGTTAVAGALWLDTTGGGVYLCQGGSPATWSRLVLAPELTALGGGDMLKNTFATNSKAAQGYTDKAIVADGLTNPLTTAQVTENGNLYFTQQRALAAFDGFFTAKTVRELSGGNAVLTDSENYVFNGGGAVLV